MQRTTIEKFRSNLPGSLFFFLTGIYRMPRQLLTVDITRFFICYFRKLFFINIMRNTRSLENLDEGVGKNTIMHNLKGQKDVAVNRSHLLIRPVIAIDKVIKNIENCKVLTVGPRTEGELFNLMGYGFKSKNIRGLDLISYSPKVDLGDMHNMPYEDNSFDVIFLGWVMAYSNDRVKAAKEIMRVAKSGAIIAVGASYDPKTDEEIQAQMGYLTGTDDKFRNAEHMMEPFGDNIKHVYFCQDVEDQKQFCDMITIFCIK
ncbi:MAG: class I SAM-dependent methyltransferase [Rickettsiales bacterium]|nr:class I SAM-dependent methyltransferase [Pseudomonadota bacterium]MDA0967440.1 class I SAM-dependent methyltransferase [Pseudomonadota bacterium]MDG4544192.1 class I SAM-dependent methyltransferase [Rickettsiales bacterium]MDG4546373.1 class I SAM-dependent methyltransferase [Rickettsiales bacterium]